ncbi:MAG TPA: nucleotidyltransferase domain-containing protein, partial [Phnomibacter sp.]|nr:nucleotidyltransferase domain-containing protein [Phnomibacter sp.]
MVTLKNIEEKIGGLLKALEDAGYKPRKAILFGSYAKGHPHAYSDLDVAIWADGFSGNALLDIERTARLLRPFHPIELNPFHTGETKSDNPFIE